MHNFKKKLGEVIRQRREMFGLLQPALSELAGVSLRTIQLVENGAANPSLDTLEKMIDPLGLELQVAIKNSGSPENT